MAICVYTAIFGQYDELMDQPVAADSESSFICFTDDATLTSDTWEIRVIEPAFPDDSVRSARLLKILGHESLSDFNSTLYIDASVLLRRAPENIIAEWLDGGHTMALATHSYREQVLDEFDEVVRLNYDDRARVYEQLTDYAISHSEALTSRPLWTGMLARRQSPDVARAMRVWANHVLRYSRRDQLSVVVALQASALPYRSIEIDNFHSDVHEWPVIEKRRISRGKASELTAGPFVAEARRSHFRIKELEREVAVLNPTRVAELERTVQALEAQIAQGTAERATLEQRLDDSKYNYGALQQKLRANATVPGAFRHLVAAIRHRFTARR